eukprot:9655838-Prorocentrum_lima.AAC.1
MDQLSHKYNYKYFKQSYKYLVYNFQQQRLLSMKVISNMQVKTKKSQKVMEHQTHDWGCTWQSWRQLMGISAHWQWQWQAGRGTGSQQWGQALSTWPLGNGNGDLSLVLGAGNGNGVRLSGNGSRLAAILGEENLNSTCVGWP